MHLPRSSSVLRSTRALLLAIALSSPACSDAHEGKGEDSDGATRAEDAATVTDAAFTGDASSTSAADAGATTNDVDANAAAQPKDAGTRRDAATPGNGRDASVASDAAGGGSDASGGSSEISCDRRKLVCRRAEPVCPQGETAQIVDGCFGECVRIDSCACNEPAACPDSDSYTCYNHAKHCGPYVF